MKSGLTRLSIRLSILFKDVGISLFDVGKDVTHQGELVREMDMPMKEVFY